MTATRDLTVVPPHGPLAWLFPELLRFDREAPGGAFDMRRGSGEIGAVLAAGDEAAARCLRVQAGPRGRTVAAALRSALRRAGRSDVEVITAPIGAPCWEDLLLAAASPFDAAAGASARILDGVPFFATSAAPAPGPVHTRLGAGWWGLLPGDVWPDEARLAWHTVLRERCPDRALRHLAFENHALAGIDLFAEALTRGTRLPRAGPRARPIVIGIDGIDGAGKSTHLDRLQAWLEGRGLRVVRHKIYRHGVFHDTVTDMTRQCAGGNALHLWPLQRHVKLLDSLKYWHECVEPDLAPADVLLFDRYVQTHCAAGAGRYHHDPFAREMLGVYPRADAVFVLDLPVAEALRRLAARTVRTVDENPYMLQRFRTLLLDIAAADGHCVLDATAPIDAAQERMRATVLEALRQRGQP